MAKKNPCNGTSFRPIWPNVPCSAYFPLATSDPHLLAGFPRPLPLQLQAPAVWSEYSLK